MRQEAIEKARLEAEEAEIRRLEAEREAARIAEEERQRKLREEEEERQRKLREEEERKRKDEEARLKAIEDEKQSRRDYHLACVKGDYETVVCMTEETPGLAHSLHPDDTTLKRLLAKANSSRCHKLLQFSTFSCRRI